MSAGPEHNQLLHHTASGTAPRFVARRVQLHPEIVHQQPSPSPTAAAPAADDAVVSSATAARRRRRPAFSLRGTKTAGEYRGDRVPPQPDRTFSAAPHSRRRRRRLPSRRRLQGGRSAADGTRGRSAGTRRRPVLVTVRGPPSSQPANGVRARRRHRVHAVVRCHRRRTLQHVRRSATDRRRAAAATAAVGRGRQLQQFAVAVPTATATATAAAATTGGSAGRASAGRASAAAAFPAAVRAVQEHALHAVRPVERCRKYRSFRYDFVPRR